MENNLQIFRIWSARDVFKNSLLLSANSYAFGAAFLLKLHKIYEKKKKIEIFTYKSDNVFPPRKEGVGAILLDTCNL